MAESRVKLIQEFNNILTTDKDQHQYIPQYVEDHQY